MGTIAERLKNIRTKKDLTITELAKLASISPSYISDTENGRVTPSIKTLNKLASALGVSSSYFIEQQPTKIFFHELKGVNNELDEFLNENPDAVRSWLELAKDCEKDDIKPEDIKAILKIIKNANNPT